MEFKHFTAIDNLPLFNYCKILDENELRYLFVLQDYFELPVIDEKKTKELFEVWEKINDEIINLIGISDDFKQQFRIKRSIALLKCEMICSEDNSLQNIIDIKELELKKLEPLHKSTIDESIILIETKLKMQIDEKRCSVKKFYNYIKYLQKQKQNEN